MTRCSGPLSRSLAGIDVYKRQVLDCLWEHSPLTVMELVERLSQKVGWAKSTTITTLRRMEEKGLVHCEVTGRTRHYRPSVRCV